MRLRTAAHQLTAQYIAIQSCHSQNNRPLDSPTFKFDINLKGITYIARKLKIKIPSKVDKLISIRY